MSHNLSGALKEKGLKTTPARLAILNMFSLGCKPMNAEYIHQKLKSKDINLVTIYRNLASLEQANILKRIDLQKGSAHYELSSSDHHHHIICTDCGTVESFTGCDIKQLSKDALKKSSKFKVVNQHSIEMFGLCRSCVKV